MRFSRSLGKVLAATPWPWPRPLLHSARARPRRPSVRCVTWILPFCRPTRAPRVFAPTPSWKFVMRSTAWPTPSKEPSGSCPPPSAPRSKRQWIFPPPPLSRILNLQLSRRKIPPSGCAANKTARLRPYCARSSASLPPGWISSGW